MIRMTLALILCIGVTMVILGQDVDGPQGSDDPGPEVTQGTMDSAVLSRPGRLALDDEEGALKRALATSPAPASEPQSQTAFVQTASLAKPGQMDADLHYVTGNRVNIRSGPSTAMPVVDQVVRDQRVEVLDETPDGWMRIRIVDTGTEAFIFGRFLSPLEG